MDTTTRHRNAPPDGAAVDAVRVAGLEKSFGPVTAVRGLDLVIHRGETVALLAESQGWLLDRR